MAKNVKSSYLFKMSRGNRKLVPNQDTAFLIWNLPACITCPYATEHCKKACYARKAERAYPQVLPARLRNLEDSKRADFVERMTATIRNASERCKKAHLIVRIHESGDFYNQEYADKWLAIAHALEDDARIVFINYTKSFPYFDGVALPSNFHIRASVWDDTRPEMLETIERNAWPIYTAVEKFTDADTFHQCRCEDCATCGKCWSAEPFIACEIH